MQKYELMVVMRPDIDEKDTKKRDDIVKKLLSGLKYTVEKITTLGKKQLAYTIKHSSEGVYVLVELQGEALNVSALEKQMRLGNDVLRYLLTRVE